jgi:hypothetical protein
VVGNGGHNWKGKKMRIDGMTMADRIRHMANGRVLGHAKRSPAEIYIVAGGCAFYHNCPDEWKRREVGREEIAGYPGNWRLIMAKTNFGEREWDLLKAFSDRYRRFVHYVREVEPAWKYARTLYFADNSVEVEEVNKHGTTRRRMTLAPGGDACF